MSPQLGRPSESGSQEVAYFRQRERGNDVDDVDGLLAEALRND
jgi:hypothetical protein